MYSGRKPTTLSSSATRSFMAAPCATLFTYSGSPTISSSVMRGLREEYGSWKINCMFCRSRLSASFSSADTLTRPMLRSLNQISPPVGS